MITRDDWLKALKDAEGPLEDDDSVTALEFAALIGMGRHSANLRLRKLVAAGKALRTTKRIRRTDGMVVRVTSYRLITEGAMKHDDLDVELNPGLDGADTLDADDAATGAGEALNAQQPTRITRIYGRRPDLRRLRQSRQNAPRASS